MDAALPLRIPDVHLPVRGETRLLDPVPGAERFQQLPAREGEREDPEIHLGLRVVGRRRALIEQRDLESAVLERAGERGTDGAATDDDDVETIYVSHGTLPQRRLR